MKLTRGADVWLVLGAKIYSDAELLSVVKDRVQRAIDTAFFYTYRNGQIYCMGKTAFETEADALKRALELQEGRVDRLARILEQHKLNAEALRLEISTI